MSCDLIKILVINHKRLWYIPINFLNTDDVILKLYTSLCQKAKCTLFVWSTVSIIMSCKLIQPAMNIGISIGTGEFFFWTHFRLSLWEIYQVACAVKNDTPIMCTVGRWDMSPEKKEW